MMEELKGAENPYEGCFDTCTGYRRYGKTPYMGEPVINAELSADYRQVIDNAEKVKLKQQIGNLIDAGLAKEYENEALKQQFINTKEAEALKQQGIDLIAAELAKETESWLEEFSTAEDLKAIRKWVESLNRTTDL
jgi:HD-GYP domain-containing protein (c-di-GMP phosphodiesterase class II)